TRSVLWFTRARRSGPRRSAARRASGVITSRKPPRFSESTLVRIAYPTSLAPAPLVSARSPSRWRISSSSAMPYPRRVFARPLQVNKDRRALIVDAPHRGRERHRQRIHQRGDAVNPLGALLLRRSDVLVVVDLHRHVARAPAQDRVAAVAEPALKHQGLEGLGGRRQGADGLLHRHR